MLKQSVNSDQTGRQIALNGHWVKLGVFKDVLSFGAMGPLAVSYSFSTTEQGVRSQPSLTLESNQVSRSRLKRLVDRIEGEFQWSEEDDEPTFGPYEASFGGRLESLYPPLVYAATRLTLLPDDQGRRDSVVLSVKPRENYDDDVDFASSSIIEMSDSLKQEIASELPDAEIDSCLMTNFLPGELIVFYDRARLEAQRAAAFYVPEAGRTHTQTSSPSDVPAAVFDVINSWLVAHDLSPVPHNVSHTPFRVRSYIARRIGEFRDPAVRHLSDSRVIDPSDLRAKIEQAFLATETQRTEVQFRLPRPLREANTYVRDFFLTGVRYLGPLREEPKAVYPAEALARPDDVGVRGEHTAAVLDLNRNRQVQHIAPPGGQPGVQSVRLAEALEQWLQYLGVAQNVEIKDAGKFGRQLKVRTEKNGDFHDLTHVGVGVSQVLPIVVMCLLAPTPSLLLFEQPELHLHPKVQARLADFFLAMGKLDKQCLLETHSEYLVDRLRLRIAESHSAEVLSMVKIYFTDKVNGDTVCKNVELTEFGSIKNWPDDFFDEAAEASSKILRAASAKRSKALRKQS
jgi:predicted ATPase